MLLLGMNGAIGQVPVDIRTAQPVVLPDPDRSELARFDEPVDGHVRNAHEVRDLADGQQRLAEVPFRHPVSYPIPRPGVVAEGDNSTVVNNSGQENQSAATGLI